MESKMATYLFQRSGSQNWHIRLQFPGQRIERSLGTPDRREAELLALPLIQEHKAKLYAKRPRIETAWRHKLAPGRTHAGPDDTRIIATDRELIYLAPDGEMLRTEPNGAPGFQWTAPPRSNREAKAAFDELNRPKLATRNGDDSLIEIYIAHRNITGYKAKECRDTWALYKALVGKPLKEATREDGRKMVAHYQGQGLKSRSIRKRLMWLTAAVNLAIDEGHLRFNPFKGRDNETLAKDI
jgi:hypothetical protein